MSSDGTAIDTMVTDGGIAEVFSGGLARFAPVSSGGTDDVFRGGAAGFTTVNNGGHVHRPHRSPPDRFRTQAVKNDQAGAAAIPVTMNLI